MEGLIADRSGGRKADRRVDQRGGYPGDRKVVRTEGRSGGPTGGR